MIGMEQAATAARLRSRRAEEREFHMMLRIGIAFFVVAIALRRMMPWTWTLSGRSGPQRQSILKEARQAAHNTIPFAFMG